MPASPVAANKRWGGTVIYIWEASFGTWVIKKSMLHGEWTLVWHDANRQPIKASHYPDPQSAVDAVVQKRSGVSEWDNAVGMSRGKSSLAGWEVVEHFP